MPFPLFLNFQTRKAARKVAAKAKKTAKATAHRAARSQIARDIKKTARQAQTSADRITSTLSRQLGKVGSILRSLLKESQVPPEEAAAVMEQAVRDSGGTPSVTVKPPAKAQTQTPARRPSTSPARRDDPPEITFREYQPDRPMGNTVEVQVSGRRRRYPVNDPAITGEMIDVQSSNVHSIGFEFNQDDTGKGTLKVRFLQGKAGSKTAGPLYHYFEVHVDVFEAFRRAASKGKFVWDRLRVRGTVSGHQVQYQLAGITRGYVPRQAKRFGPNEYFVGRSFKGKNRQGEIREFESKLPDERVRRLPQRGLPNRGTPNRGS